MINLNRAAVPIPEKLFFKIGEVCDITGVQAHVLRYWESEFPMLAPQKNRAGQRTYRKRDVEMALRIKELLYDDQYTIAGAKKKLTLELRGASKLKVVTPEMSAPQSSVPQSSAQLAPHQTISQPAPNSAASSTLEVQRQTALPDAITVEPQAPASKDQRVALRRLSDQLHELLILLDKDETSGHKSYKK
jgi:DNA-binding transcriptional MerR regulator